jgi:hypothetical protein
MSDHSHDHEHRDEGRSLGHYAADYWANWREYEGPIGRKLWLVTRNRARAFTVGRGCCGHPGEPGC